MVKILRGDGTVLRVGGLDDVADLVMDGLVSASDRLFGAGRGVVAIGDMAEMGWAFATAQEQAPYASYEIIRSDTRSADRG